MIQHILLFALLSLISSLVYHSLRADCLKTAILVGLRRFLSFLVVALAFGVVLMFFTRWL